MRDSKGAVKGKEESDRIHVFVRVRPRSEDEVRRGEAIAVDVIPGRNEIALDGRERRFVFDGILTATATNRQVYSHVGRPLVDAAFSGFNGTLMAYGQTGTGKTFTLMSRDGVCMLMVQKLFRRLQKDRYHEYKVFVSYLQIYQEKIYDLLNSNHKLEMVLREDPKKGVYIENLTEYVVRSADEVMSLMRSSKKRLVFAETRMNRLSSRSHSVCQITIQRSPGRTSSQSSIHGNTFTKTSSPSSPPRQARSPGYTSEGSKIPTMQQKGDHVTRESKIPLMRQHSSPNQTQTSTPNPRSAKGLRRPSKGKYSASVTSLPDIKANESDLRHSRRSLPGPQMGRGFSSRECETEDSDVMDSETELSLNSLHMADDEDQDVFGDEREDEDEEFLQSIRIIDDVVIKGKLNICDLAGSERVKRAQVEGERLSELQHINLSLLELGNTIHALSEGTRTHIPFRNSSLTRLLQDSLGGNCKTSFVMCISPTNVDKMETRCTLEFGQRALKVKNTAHVNMEVDFMKLAADLRRRLEAQELEMKAQKENFERQMLALKSDQNVELSEKDTLLELEKEQAQHQVEQLKSQKETLEKLLEEERNQRALLEQTMSWQLEKSLQEEKRQNVGALNELKQELEKLKRELHEEKRRSLAIEQREKDNLEQILRAERQHAAEMQTTFQSLLEEERMKQEEDAGRDVRDAYCQSPAIEKQFPQIPVDTEHTSTETLYNVLLAEIMSLQLLYQMQDLADSCRHVTVHSRDSGWTEYDEEALENVGLSLLEKGGLILNSLRSVQAVDAISMASTESLRDAFMLQFPLSPKTSKDLGKPFQGTSTNLADSRELNTASKHSQSTLASKESSAVSSGVSNAGNGGLESASNSNWNVNSITGNRGLESASNSNWNVNSITGNRGLESASDSSMGSFCEQEPLRARRQPSDSGCSSQHSGTDSSPMEQKSSLQAEFIRRVNRGSNVCVPLAEEDDEEYLDEEMTESSEHCCLLTEKVSTLERDLVRLKSELDSETVSFFSAVFMVELPEQDNQGSLQIRYLFDCVREKLLAEIACQDSGLQLPLPVLEQAVNLLLVNKTVRSCILVIRNRACATDKEETLQVDQQVQTDETAKPLRRKVRKDASVLTEPWPRSPVHHRECQTSDECLASSLLAISSHDHGMDHSTTPLRPLSELLTVEVTSSESIFSDELSRRPDGASRTATPVSGSEETRESRDSHMPTNTCDQESDGGGAKKKKSRLGLFACLGPKMSFKKQKNRDKNQPASEKVNSVE